jgi:serine/threonine-protein kinase
MRPEQVTAGGSACPDEDELAAFNSDQLPHGRLEAIAEHLSHCGRCAGCLEALQSDNTIETLLRQPATDVPSSDEVACRQLEDRARAIPPSETDLPTVPIRAAGPFDEASLPAPFGAYLLLEKLGQGGMGIVFKARHESLKHLVALKMVRAGVHACDEERTRFGREGEALARVRHANVVQIHEFAVQQGHLFYTMDLLEGGTLTARLKNGPLPEREAAELLRTLAQAVQVLHDHNIIHRDLKPGNILFDADGTPKITDFGLVKLLDSGASDTRSYVVLGTAAYMAPEQARGESHAIGPAADLYALGAILYQALTGHAPFEDERLALPPWRPDEPVPPSRHRPGLDRDLEAVCLKCLQPQPHQRYASAAALADDLGRWLDGEPTQVRPPGWLARRWRDVRRHPRIAGAVVVLAALFAAGTLAWLRLDPERSRKDIERRLGRGEAVTLMEPTGPPRFARWLAGEGKSQKEVSPDGVFSIHAWGQALLELVHDPQRTHYRLKARLRHDDSDMVAGEIGLFVAHCAHATPAGVVHQFAAVSFNDIVSQQDVHRQIFAGQRNPQPALPGNPLALDPHLYSEAGGDSWSPGIYCGPRFFFKPARNAGVVWRDLTVEVRPRGIRGFWGDNPIGELSADAYRDKTRAYLVTLRQLQPDEPRGQGLDPVYSVRGPLGLYVRNGSASFCRVVVEPLDDAP